jgi:hypothetical protein
VFIIIIMFYAETKTELLKCFLIYREVMACFLDLINGKGGEE